MIAGSLAGKVALLTGVSRKAGIGVPIAQAFAEAGAQAAAKNDVVCRSLGAGEQQR